MVDEETSHALTLTPALSLKGRGGTRWGVTMRVNFVGLVVWQRDPSLTFRVMVIIIFCDVFCGVRQSAFNRQCSINA